MICYLTHNFDGDKSNIERAKKITKGLQKQDLANCYICPLVMFPFTEYQDVGYDGVMELRIDLLTCADRLIVAGEQISKEVRMEIDFAKLVKMEVMRLEENGDLRPFTE